MENIAGKYKILKQLGQGGFGKVLLGQHIHLNAKYAIKVLNDEISKDETLIERFKREAEVLMAFVHPGSTQLRDFGMTEDGNYYMAMDFCEGTPLDEVIKQEGRLKPGRVLDLMMQTLEVLGAAHKMGIVHRDIKPANLMLQKGTQGEDIIKVLDFGIAKLTSRIHPDDQGQTLTVEGAIIGTPKYMAPEQAYGEKDIDHRVDIYALGIMMYQLLVGQVPFQGSTVIETIMKHMQEPPKPFQQVIPESQIPEEVEDIVFKAIAKDKKDRFQNAEEFRARCYQVAQILAAVGMESGDMEDAATMIGPVIINKPEGQTSLESESQRLATKIENPQAPTQISGEELLAEISHPPKPAQTQTPEPTAPSLEVSPAPEKKSFTKLFLLLSLAAIVLVVILVALPKKTATTKTPPITAQKALLLVNDKHAYPVDTPMVLIKGNFQGKIDVITVGGVDANLEKGHFFAKINLNKHPNSLLIRAFAGKDLTKSVDEKKITIHLNVPPFPTPEPYGFRDYEKDLKHLRDLCQKKHFLEAGQLVERLMDRYGSRALLRRYQKALEGYPKKFTITLTSNLGEEFPLLATPFLKPVSPASVEGKISISSDQPLWVYVFSSGGFDTTQLTGNALGQPCKLQGRFLFLFAKKKLPREVVEFVLKESKKEKLRGSWKGIEDQIINNPTLQLQHFFLRRISFGKVKKRKVITLK